mgnify:CR=1 FL=1
MKENFKKVLIVIIALLLIAGTIILFSKKLVFGLNYENSQKIEINLGKQFETKDIEKIAKEVLGNQPVLIQPIEVYKDAVSITTSEITEEQKTDLITKINEKYETTISAEDVTIETNAHFRGREILKPYIIPFVITTVIILVYLAIRYHKINSLKVLCKSIGIIAIAQLILLAIITVTRTPINAITMPIALTVYAISTYVCTTIFDKKLEKDTKNSKEV